MPEAWVWPNVGAAGFPKVLLKPVLVVPKVFVVPKAKVVNKKYEH